MLGKGCWRHVWRGNVMAFLSETCLSTALLQLKACRHKIHFLLLSQAAEAAVQVGAQAIICKSILNLLMLVLCHMCFAQGTELKSVGGDEHIKDSFTSRTRMVLSSLQTNFEAAAEQGSVKKRRLSSNSSHGSAPQVAFLCTLLCAV